METVLLVFVLAILLFCIKSLLKDPVLRFITYSFVLYWYGTLIISTFSPYGILDISFGTYLMAIIGTSSFVFGMIISSPQKKYYKYFDRTSIYATIEKLFFNKFFVGFYVIVIAFYAKYAVTAVTLASIQGYAEMLDQLEYVFMGNTMAQIIYGYVVTPMLHLALVLLSYAFLKLKGRLIDVLIPLLTLVLFFIEYLLISGGRSIILIAVIYFLITYLILFSRDFRFKVSIRNATIMFVVFIVFSSVFTYMNIYRTTGTFDRTLEKESLEKSAGGAFETMARYSLSPIVMLDKSIKDNYLDRFGYQYGKASLMGFDTWLSIGLRQVGIYYKTASYITEYLEDNYFEYDKEGHKTNYAYTGLFYHYIDFGLLGIVLFPLLFGYFFCRVIVLFYRKPSLFSFLLLGIGYFMMLHSLFTCYLIKGWVALYIIVLFLIISCKKGGKKRVLA